MNLQLMNDSVNLLLYGMGSVFVFLTTLVLATYFMSMLVSRFFPEAAVTGSPDPVVEPVDSLTKKIIQAAIDQHRGG